MAVAHGSDALSSHAHWRREILVHVCDTTVNQLPN